MSGLTMTLEQEKRYCEVDGKPGYFHTWEHRKSARYAQVYGIVEFADGVRRVDPICIKFCDEYTTVLAGLTEQKKYQE